MCRVTTTCNHGGSLQFGTLHTLPPPSCFSRKKADFLSSAKKVKGVRLIHHNKWQVVLHATLHTKLSAVGGFSK